MSIDDDRVCFYLRHRDQIEEWASLRTEAAIAIDGWLLELRPAVEELCAELGADVRMHCIDAPDFGWPGYRLVRTSWPEAGHNDPPASVCLEWQRKKTTLRGSATPYTGLRAPKERPLGALLRANEASRAARQSRQDALTDWWIGFGYCAPVAPFPEQADSYRDRLRAALRDAWTTYAPLVDAAVLGGP